MGSSTLFFTFIFIRSIPSKWVPETQCMAQFMHQDGEKHAHNPERQQDSGRGALISERPIETGCQGMSQHGRCNPEKRCHANGEPAKLKMQIELV